MKNGLASKIKTITTVLQIVALILVAQWLEHCLHTSRAATGSLCT